jgi:ectoine hydroxylase-related dioxygenase (phytanoyl-CoA dioxygenase family)
LISSACIVCISVTSPCVLRSPRIGRGKHNVHFDAYGSACHSAMARLAAEGHFEELFSAYQATECSLSETGVSLTQPRMRGVCGEGMEWHSDGGEGACTVLLSLQDVSDEQGCVGVKPRSHLRYSPGKDMYDADATYTNVLTTTANTEEEVWHGYKAGAPLLIDARTLHCARENSSDKFRVVLWFIFDVHD